MTKKQKKNLIRIIVSAVITVGLMFLPFDGLLKFAAFLVPYLIVGYDILIKAVKGVINRQPFDECFLMTVATIGAFALALTSSGDYLEAVAVMLFYQIGEWFQSYAVGKSRKNIGELMDIRPDYANIENEDGELEQVDPDDIDIGTVIIVQPGEKIPIDGIVTEGNSVLDTAALTGESVPRNVKSGDEVISGCINLSGLLKIRTTKEFGESTASKILDLVENASSHKSKSEKFITKFARIYTPAVVLSALALALLPPAFEWFLTGNGDFLKWIYRALTFLVISCPCALVVSVPLGFFVSIGNASRNGILIKGSNYMEQLAKAETVVFDKTGTLTKGVFEVTAVHPEKINETELLHLAAHVERYSTHPIANSLRNAYPDEHDSCAVEDTEEISGKGIRAKVNGNIICVGNEKMMAYAGAKISQCEHSETVIHVSQNGTYMGHIVISDVVKATSKEAVQSLRQLGVKRTVVLTGDSRKTAESVSKSIGIDEFYSELLPGDKVEKAEQLLSEKKSGGSLLFVGDGINDAPVLSRADIGIAMGAMGSDAAIEAADVVLMDDDPLKIAKAIRIARKCMRIVKQNIWFSIGIKFFLLLMVAVFANMWLAIFADVGVMVLAVLNSIRCIRNT